MVNYKLDNETLIIHDGLYDADYSIVGWETRGYYHFWVNETPIRNYIVMRDNRDILKEDTQCRLQDIKTLKTA